MQKQLKLITLTIFLLLFSILFNFYIASRGVFHIDTFVHFDSGFRILKGDVPTKDFWIVHGLLVDYIQSFFFYLFGFSWFSYILHSSIFNASICLFSFYLFYNYLNLNLIWSTFFALLLSCLAYPVSGSPFLDLHSTYFSLFAIYFIIIGIIKENYKFWFYSSFFLVVAFFCKQVPAFYIGLLLTIFCICISLLEKKIKIFLIFIFGGVSAVLILLIFLILQNVDFENFFLQLFLFPSSFGGSRYANYDLNFNNLFSTLKFLHLFVGIFISIIIINILKVKNYLISKDFKIAVIIILFFIGCVFHQIYTKNQIFIFFLIPLVTAFSIYSLKNLHFERKNKTQFLLAFLCLVICIKYINRFDIERKFHELSNVDLSKAIAFSNFDNKFKGLKWISPSFKDPKEEINILNNMKMILQKKDNKNKMLLSEYNLFSLLLNKNFHGISRTYDQISYPNKNTKYFNKYKLFVKQKIIENKIDQIFVLDSAEIIPFRLNHIVFNYVPESCFNKTYINKFIVKLDIKKCEYLK